jgi:hypothetical protein
MSTIDCSGTDKLIIQLNEDAEVLDDKLYHIVKHEAHDSISIDAFNRMEQEFIRIQDESRRLRNLAHTVEIDTFKYLYCIRKYLLRIHRYKGLLFDFEKPSEGASS